MQIENCKLKVANCLRLTTQVVEQIGVSRVSTTNGASRISASCIHRQAWPAAQICNFHFSIFIFQCFALTALAILCLGLPSNVSAQTVPDKIVASVTNGSQAIPDVITYSDLVWQLALEPSRPTPARPSSEELKQALETLEQQT